MRLTERQVQMMERVRGNPFCFPAYKGESQTWRSLEARGLVKKEFGGSTRYVRHGHMSGNAWVELTPKGDHALNVFLKGRLTRTMRAVLEILDLVDDRHLTTLILARATATLRPVLP